MKKKKCAYGAKLPKYYLGGNTEGLTEDITNIGMSAASAFNPLLGAALKLGQGIGSKTKNVDGTYKNKAGEVLDNVVNPQKVVGNIVDNISNPTLSGIGNQLTFGLLGKSLSEKKAEEAKQAQNNIEVQKMIDNSAGVLSSYPTKGVVGASFAYGGNYKGYENLPTPTDDSQSTRLSSDSAVYNGNTHENGGIELNNQIEIEDKEVIQENKVYSDRLKPNTDILSALGIAGFKLNDKSTFAESSKALLKKKGDLEKSTDPLDQFTAQNVIPRIDNALDVLFQDQQTQNNGGMKKKAYGGFLTDPSENPKGKPVKEQSKISGPIYNKINPSTTEEMQRLNMESNLAQALRFKNLLTGINKDLVPSADYVTQFQGDIPQQQVGGGNRSYTYVDPQAIVRADSVINATRPALYGKRAYGGYTFNDGRFALNSENYIPLADVSKLPSRVDLNGNPVAQPVVGGYSNDMPLYDLPNLYGKVDLQGNRLGGDMPLADVTPLPKTLSRPDIDIPYLPAGDTTIIDENKNGISKFLNNNMGDLTNLAGTIGNELYINKLKTNTPARTVPNPRFSYLDTSSSLYNRTGRGYREALTEAQRSGKSTNAVVNNLYATKLQTDANIGMAESAKRQGAVDSYLNRVDNTNQFNSGVLSQNDFYNTQRENEKIGLSQKNYNNFIQGILGNQQWKDLTSLDRDKAKITAASQGNRGIVERLQSDPQLAEALKRLLG